MGFLIYIYAMLIVVLLSYLVSIVGYFMVLHKAGISGWKAFIPVYRDYLVCKVCNAKGAFIVLAICFVVFFVFYEFMSAWITILISLVVLAVMIVVNLRLMHRLINCFGYFGASSWVLAVGALLILPRVLIFIIVAATGHYKECYTQFRSFKSNKESIYGRGEQEFTNVM